MGVKITEKEMAASLESAGQERSEGQGGDNMLSKQALEGIAAYKYKA